jgi:drug/metabolite transporter (DMT)-like permease
VWLAGIAADGLGLIAQAVALADGRLAVVQPLLVTSLVFALPLGARLSGQRVRPLDAAAAVVVGVAVAAFIIVADPSGGRPNAPLDRWLIAGAACAVLCAPPAVLGRRGPARRRAALLGLAAGITFALSAALIKAVVDALSGGVLHVLGGWELYALIAVGYVSMTLNQLALDTGALAPAIAAGATLDPIVSVLLGVTVLREDLDASAGRMVVLAAVLAAAVAGSVVLARAEARPEPGPERV